MQSHDYYAVLEIDPSASRSDIEQAYERLARQYQPDPDKEPLDPDRMRLVDEAFDILDDPARRAAYHRTRGLPEPPPPEPVAEEPPAETPRPARRMAPKTLVAFGLIVAGLAALITGIVLAVLVILDDDPGYVTLDNGLKFRDIVEGAGGYPPPGSLVTVHYTGRLEDGTVFDTSLDGQPFQFNIGQGQVIEGWDIGVALMQAGGRRELIIPPELAYGEEGAGPIPPNATLTFEIQLITYQAPEAQNGAPEPQNGEGNDDDTAN